MSRPQAPKPTKVITPSTAVDGRQESEHDDDSNDEDSPADQNMLVEVDAANFRSYA